MEIESSARAATAYAAVALFLFQTPIRRDIMTKPFAVFRIPEDQT